MEFIFASFVVLVTLLTMAGAIDALVYAIDRAKANLFSHERHRD